MIWQKVSRLFAAFVLVGFVLAGCAQTGPVEATHGEIDTLSAEIAALSPDVDPLEARRAAEIAYSYSAQLAREYEITDPPLIHNSKVNAGIKPRGLCWHWAEDMEARLDAENFETLHMERAIANSDVAFRIDHSTAIIVANGEGMYEGIVLDPWRYGGRLYAGSVVEDTRYPWRPQAEVLAEKAAKQR